MDDEIKKILKSVELPSQVSTTHKNNLRRELLNSKHFEKRRFWNHLNIFERLIGGVVAIVMLIIVFNQNNNSNEIADLLDLSNQHYAGFFAPNIQSSFNNNIQIYGKVKEPIDFNIKQTVDFKKSKIRIIALDKSNSIELDEYIVDGSIIYRTKFPKLFYKNASIHNPDLNSSFTYSICIDSVNKADSIFINLRDSLDGKIVIKKLISPNSTNDEAFIVYQENTNGNSELGKSSKPFYYPVDKQVDLFKYFKTNPLEILNDLSKSDSIVTIGEEYSEEFDLTCKIVENIVPLSKMAFETLIMNIEKTDSIHITAENKMIFKHLSDSIGNDIKSILNNVNIDDHFQKIEQVNIDPESGKICSIKFIVARNGEKINLSKIVFKDQKIINDTYEKFEVTNKFKQINNPISKIIRSTQIE